MADKTGTDLLIGKLIISIGDLFNANMNQEPHLYLAILYIATFSLLYFQQCHSIIMAPVAIAIAINLNVDPRPFMVAVCSIKLFYDTNRLSN